MANAYLLGGWAWLNLTARMLDKEKQTLSLERMVFHFSLWPWPLLRIVVGGWVLMAAERIRKFQ